VIEGPSDFNVMMISTVTLLIFELKNWYNELFYQQSFLYFHNEFDRTHFTARIMPESDITIELMYDGEES
jgi:hypothetical protein